jgi:hypothetical protein
VHASGLLLPSISVLSSSYIAVGNPLPSKPPVHDNFVILAKRSCHFPDLAIDGVVLVVRADEGPIGRVDLAHVFLISGLPLMKSRIARILSYAVCWIVALTASALAAEKNPPGDIPDDQVFVPYASVAGGYSLKVPEGWARSEKGSDVGFIDKFDGVAVIVDKVATAPTTKDIVAKLEKTERGFKTVNAKEIRLPAGPALLIKYESESEANSVTNKRIRLEDEAYVFYKNGKMAILTVWAPVGADNADQWKLISESFRW